ncbi:zinc ABC transporter ATP-binding protein ZnuC [uncultured Desulfuromusa sp.]|uniref:zinc ABC transporter ATP-binding protein ZnuC n=1 Tax=uncultured Desulfuromusa sp. TaxID=219183 RepID=UPI002AA5F0DE|nr:zinc ABC transporter ATP-binding protein ZnuC [uncultured Desulfuromusa sp.]
MSNPEQSLLNVSAVDLTLGKRLLLENINFKIGSGEILTIIGPNGAGKTTLLRVALGLQRPTTGQVTQRRGLTVGYMPQRLQLDPTFPLTVKRFLFLACNNDRSRVLPLLEEVGATHVFESSMKNLSGGEMQRVLLARALIRDPELLVLDEPVQGVDVHGQIELYQLISKVRDRRGCAVLMVSHDLHLVMAATDQVLCLNRHICCSGTPESVTNDPAFLELFGPTAVQNIAIYVHDQSHHHDECATCSRRAAND